MGRAVMAAARDQAARILRPGREMAEGEAAGDASPPLADQLRSHLGDETTARRPVETPAKPAIEKPAIEKPAVEQPAVDKPATAPAAPPASASAAPKSGKRKFVLMGILTLLALAAVSYGSYYLLVRRFYFSTDDAYVRANNTMLGARVAGHISAILPGDNTVVRTGDVVFRIDDGDYRIAVDAARTKIATQQATIDRMRRQVTPLGSAVEQAQAQVVSAEAALKRAGLDFDRQQALSTKGFASRATFEGAEAGRDHGFAALK